MNKTQRICCFALVACGISIAALARAAPTRWDPAAGGNGHLYEAIRFGRQLSWESARAEARARGPGWDLATITSAEENAFVKSLFEGDRTSSIWNSRKSAIFRSGADPGLAVSALRIDTRCSG